MDYTDTTSELARDARVTGQTVRLYADLNLLDCVRASNGNRLFRRGQAERVREIYAQRVGHRRRKSA